VNRAGDDPVSLSGTPDDETVRRLRRALAREAEAVEPGDGLERIQERTRGGAGRRWVPWAAAVAAAAVVGLVAGAVVGLSVDDDGQVAAPPPSLTSAPAAPVPSATDAPVETGDALPVYWLGEQGTRLALFREFGDAGPQDPAARVQAAVTQALTGTPADPDYSTAWADGSAATSSLADGEIRVDLNSTAASGASMGSEVASLSVDQLVWTATAAAGEDLPVRITVAGGTPDLFGTVSLAEPFVRGSAESDPRAVVWISSLSEGESVTAGALEITGEGVNAFENTLIWTLVREGATVDQGFFGVEATDGAIDTGERGTWSLDLDLQPGSYTLTVEVPDASGGAEGTIRWFDSKQFTVE
jgi:Sporulation and spore germination